MWNYLKVAQVSEFGEPYFYFSTQICKETNTDHHKRWIYIFLLKKYIPVQLKFVVIISHLKAIQFLSFKV